MLLAMMDLSTVLQLEGAQGFQGPEQNLLDVVILLQDGQGDSSTFQRGQTDVGGLSADHILTGQSPVELDLLGQVEQAVFEEHVFGLAPGAVDDDHIMFHSAYVLIFHQLLQVVGFGAWIEDQRFAVPTYRSQLWVLLLIESPSNYNIAFSLWQTSSK